MTILLVEDEVGIREGLAAFLGLKGHEVHAVGSVHDAVERLVEFRYEVVVTDWRLHGQDARPILEAAGDRPCVVISGSPEEVDDHPAVRRVLSKPVRPAALVEELSLLLGAESRRVGDDRAVLQPVDGSEAWSLDASSRVTSRDVQEILESAVALLPPGTEGEVHERGGIVEVEILRVPEEVADALERLGGDLQIDPLTRLARWRLYADGRPAGIEVVVALEADPAAPVPWPRRPFALDCSPWSADAVRLAGRIGSARAAGCVACLGLEPAMRRALVALEAPLPAWLPPGPSVDGPAALLWASA